MNQSLQYMSENYEERKKKKTVAKKEFSTKMVEIQKKSSAKSVDQKVEVNNASDSVKSDNYKSDELKEPNSDKIGEEVSDGNDNVSVDNKSIANNISSETEHIVKTIDSNGDNEEVIKSTESNETNNNDINTEVNLGKEETDEYDKYYDRWESDSEVTVETKPAKPKENSIKVTDDKKANNIKTNSVKSKEEKTKESTKSKQNINDKQRKTSQETNSMKNSVSNQDINTISTRNENQNLENVSSEESIFDSALIIEGMEREDSHMYSSLMDQIYQNEDSVSRLENNSCSPSKEHIQPLVRTVPSSTPRKDKTSAKSETQYQLERKLFEELHDLKRFQIRSGRSNEILMVKRLVDKFRKDVKAPGMSDFGGVYSYKNYEFYLYDQLRKLSTSNQGKVALLTRSVSHENIQLIVNSNESITQSNPEMMQNTVGLDINQHNIDMKAIKSHDKDLGIESEPKLSLIAINENTSQSQCTESVDILDKNIISQINDSETQDTKRDYTNFDRSGLGLTSHTSQQLAECVRTESRESMNIKELIVEESDEICELRNEQELNERSLMQAKHAISYKSSDSQTDLISVSEAKSTIGSLRNENSLSRDISSQSSFKKECYVVTPRINPRADMSRLYFPYIYWHCFKMQFMATSRPMTRVIADNMLFTRAAAIVFQS
ncbi:unnamed protein product [Medioppia subpectinata]|uniref:Uncharacterized protein n=1 Tax=Medioppia subpectinata TaxID=1979941 RepID=A0A7R9KND6_9ACAR|nr:unnamed protein product [Medioppia subpectinata]CAG2105768.1 unnamed protein product [Medioppia subpectinata]